MTSGVNCNCNFDFYVIGLDSLSKYNKGIYEKDLELSNAIAIIKNKVIEYPESVMALGVNYITDRRDLNNMGCGGCDLIQFVDGKWKISDDYKQSNILSTEGLIANNTMRILKRFVDKWEERGETV